MQSKHLRRWGLGSHEVPFFVPRPEQRAEGARKGALEGPRGLPLRNGCWDTSTAETSARERMITGVRSSQQTSPNWNPAMGPDLGRHYS